MRYEVVWQSVAEQELADIWLNAADRDAISDAAMWLDERLSRNPLTLGESRASSVNRIACRRPIGVEFEVIQDDNRVIVRGVFRLG